MINEINNQSRIKFFKDHIDVNNILIKITKDSNYAKALKKQNQEYKDVVKSIRFMVASGYELN